LQDRRQHRLIPLHGHPQAVDEGGLPEHLDLGEPGCPDGIAGGREIADEGEGLAPPHRPQGRGGIRRGQQAEIRVLLAQPLMCRVALDHRDGLARQGLDPAQIGHIRRREDRGRKGDIGLGQAEACPARGGRRHRRQQVQVSGVELRHGRGPGWGLDERQAQPEALGDQPEIGDRDPLGPALLVEELHERPVRVQAHADHRMVGDPGLLLGAQLRRRHIAREAIVAPVPTPA
jgi:hypothetical protein